MDFLHRFIERHQLPESYLTLAEQWYLPMANTIHEQVKKRNTPYFVAINGCQGSGKSTLAEYLSTTLEHNHHCSTAILSIDDFYLEHDTRQQLGSNRHPLLRTRGVPGTHDTQLLQNTLTELRHNQHDSLKLPRFDKSRDDRAPESRWPAIALPVDVVILEGWCMGAQADTEQQLLSPCNTLESSEDPDGAWRRYVNQQLKQYYLPIFEQFDLWIMLKAPSFDNVFRWRLEQERKLAATLSNSAATRVMNEQQVLRFIQHYQRLTENCLSKLSSKVHFLFELDHNRQPQQLLKPTPLNRHVNFLTGQQ